MNPHDRVRVYAAVVGFVVACRCGKEFHAATEDRARGMHNQHHGLETARDALNGQPNLHLVEGE